MPEFSAPIDSTGSVSDWERTEMSPEAREYYEKTFLRGYKEMQEKVAKTPLAVLIWGPGSAGGDLYEKRVQIRGVLRQAGYAAFFSEEVADEGPAVLTSSKALELIQALVADFIIVIIGSPGSVAEAHDFAGFLHDIGTKMLLFIDSRYIGGYSYKGALSDLKTLYNNVHTYEYPRDIRECFLLGGVQERLRVLRTAKWQARLS